MDFQSMMDAANKNVKKATKEIGKIESEVNKEKNAVQRQLEAEKRLRIEMQRRKAEREKEIERRKEEERRKTFTIPRKNNQEQVGVNQNALKAYYEKKEREKKEQAIKAEHEKDRLMKLRMQANGGKATKKMGKHFGLDPIELQIRFGGNNEHVETLQKRKWKEEEDADEAADRLRNGVYKAIQIKKKTEDSLRANVKGPHRISTSKTNSLAGLCSRHQATRDTFSPPKDGKKSKVEEKKEPEKKKKVQLAPPVDFQSLMAAASNISQGKNIDVSQFNKSIGKNQSGSSLSNQKISNSNNQTKFSSNSRPSNSGTFNTKDKNENFEKYKHKEQISKHRKDEKLKERPTKQLSSSSSYENQARSNSKLVSKTIKKEIDIRSDDSKKLEKKKDPKGRFAKAATPPPAIPTAIPGKRYLPGDIRYKQQTSMPTGNGLFSSPSSLSSSSNNKDRPTNSNRNSERMKEADRDKEKQRKLKRERDEKEELDLLKRKEKMRKLEKIRSESKRYESRRETELREQQLREKYGIRSKSGGTSSFCRGGDDYSDDNDEYEEDDDYDSDMDDFIDDTEMDMDGMSRKEFEETLKMVNRKYDKKKWSQREKMISERDMVSDFKRIQTEENFSKRAGYIEDLREASKGRSVKL